MNIDEDKEIIAWVGKYITTKSGLLYSKYLTDKWISTNHPAIYDKIIKNTNFLPENSRMVQRFWHIFKNVDAMPRCGNPECKNPAKFYNFVKGYYGVCCASCNHKNPSVLKKMEETCMQRYGSKNNMTSKNFKEKSKMTLLEKYGVDNISKLEEIKKKKE
jgi:hypothetical protein